MTHPKQNTQATSNPRIAIWTNKGGQGKTSLALALALEFDFPVMTNDFHSPIDSVLPEGDAYHLQPGEDFPAIPAGNKVILDMGGNAEARVVAAANNADVILMPVIYNSPQEMKVFLESVAEMKQHNPRIVLVVNGCKRGKFKSISEIINNYFPQFPILEVKESRAFARVVEEGKSIAQMMNENPLNRFHFKEVHRQLSFLHEVLCFESANSAKAA